MAKSLCAWRKHMHPLYYHILKVCVLWSPLFYHTVHAAESFDELCRMQANNKQFPVPYQTAKYYNNCMHKNWSNAIKDQKKEVANADDNAYGMAVRNAEKALDEKIRDIKNIVKAETKKRKDDYWAKIKSASSEEKPVLKRNRAVEFYHIDNEESLRYQEETGQVKGQYNLWFVKSQEMHNTHQAKVTKAYQDTQEKIENRNYGPIPSVGEIDYGSPSW